jgi:hypothetical protein
MMAMTAGQDMEQINQQDAALALTGQTLAPPDSEMQAAVDAPPVEEAGAPADWIGTQSNALIAIERLKATIDEETSKLESRAVVDFDTFSQRKNRGLLELTRAIRLTSDVKVDPRVTPQLTHLRASLIRNQAALQIHLDAVREVSAIIAKSIQDVESDGTYSRALPGIHS